LNEKSSLLLSCALAIEFFCCLLLALRFVFPSPFTTFLRHCCYCLWKHSLVCGIHSRGRKSRLYPASPMRTTFPPPPHPPPLPATTSAALGGAHHFRHLLSHFYSLRLKPGDQSPSMSIRRSWEPEPPLHLLPCTLPKQQFLLSIRYQRRFNEGVVLHVQYSLRRFLLGTPARY